jgi:hypothetical protein
VIDDAFAASREFHAIAARAEALAEDQREQHRLHGGEREHAAALDRPQGDAAELQRELLHQPRPAADHPDVVAGTPLRGETSGRTGTSACARRW